MNKLNKKICTILLLTLNLISFNVLANENYPNTSIAIVDLNLILSDSKAAKNATKQFEDEPFYVLNPDTIWNKNYYEELKILENFYFTNKKPVLLLVDKKKSYDKSFKGDFNFTNNQIIAVR